MKILVACEYSGVVRDAFIRRGHDAISCDLLPSESDFGPHIQGDVRPLLRQEWDMVIAHPPCQRLTQLNDAFPSNKELPNFWSEYEDAAALFEECLNANAPMVAVENPRMHRVARERIGAWSFHMQPYHFGDPIRKQVGFWVRGLPPLMATVICADFKPMMSMTIHGERRNGLISDSFSVDRGKMRSCFFEGMAQAMAEQWG